MSGLRLGLVVPTEWEMKSFVGRDICEVSGFYGQVRCTLRWDDVLVTAVTSGIGKTNAAFTMGAVFFEVKPHCVIHVGCAGTYAEDKVRRGDVVLITEALFGDDGVMCDGGIIQPYEFMGIAAYRSEELVVFNRVTPSKELLSLFAQALPPGAYGGDGPSEGSFLLHYGSVLSVSSVSGSRKVAERRHRFYGAMIEDMETASVMLIGARLGLPVIALRGVSNVAGVRDKRQWSMDEAMYNTRKIVMKGVHILRQWFNEQERSGNG